MLQVGGVGIAPAKEIVRADSVTCLYHFWQNPRKDCTRRRDAVYEEDLFPIFRPEFVSSDRPVRGVDVPFTWVVCGRMVRVLASLPGRGSDDLWIRTRGDGKGYANRSQGRGSCYESGHVSSRERIKGLAEQRNGHAWRCVRGAIRVFPADPSLLPRGSRPFPARDVVEEGRRGRHGRSTAVLPLAPDTLEIAGPRAGTDLTAGGELPRGRHTNFVFVTASRRARRHCYIDLD